MTPAPRIPIAPPGCRRGPRPRLPRTRQPSAGLSFGSPADLYSAPALLAGLFHTEGR